MIDVVFLTMLSIGLILFVLFIAWAISDVPDEPAPPEK